MTTLLSIILKVQANCGGETFTATGLMVTERNWLDIYEPYERWTGRTIPEFFQGQEFVPSALVVSGTDHRVLTVF